MICNFCKNKFTTAKILKIHQKNAKYCVDIQVKLNTIFNCIYCDTIFHKNEELQSHFLTCMFKIQTEQQEKIKIQEIQLQEKDKQLQEKDKQITDLQNKLENIAIKSATKPTHIQNNNQRINQIVNNLIPITEEHLKEQAQYLTLEHVKNGASGYVQYALEYPLKDRVVCTDFSRRKIKYKNEKGEIVDDPEMMKLTQHLFKAVEDKNTELMNECLLEIDRKYRSTLSSTNNDLDDDETERFSGSLDFLFDELLKYKHQKLDVIDTAAGKKSELYYQFIRDICSKLCN